MREYKHVVQSAVTCHTARNKYASRPKSKTRDRNDLNIFIYIYNITN